MPGTVFPRDRGLPLWRGSPRVIVRPSTMLVAGVALAGLAPDLPSFLLVAILTGLIVALHGAVRAGVVRRRGDTILTLEPSLLGLLVAPAADAKSIEGETRDALTAVSVPIIALALLGGVSLWTPASDPLQQMLRIAAGYAVLHAMPGLPLDGGRLFHALIWYVTGSATVATRASARYAQLIAAGLVVTGLFMLPLGGDRSYWSLLFLGMGWQLSAAAAADAARSAWQRRSTSATLERFIPGVVMPPTARVVHAARLILGRRVPVLVWESPRRAVGVVTRDSLRRTPRAEWHQRSVAEIMTPIDRVRHLPADRSVAEAVELLRQERQTVIIVTAGAQPRAAVLLEQLLAPLSG